jgi:hypothetical protein
MYVNIFPHLQKRVSQYQISHEYALNLEKAHCGEVNQTKQLIKPNVLNWAWWYRPVMQLLLRWGQEDQEFKAAYAKEGMRSYLKTK